MSPDRDRADIGEAGLRTAAAVVEQMLRLTRQFSTGRWPVTLFGTPEGPEDAWPAGVEDHVNGNGSNGNGHGPSHRDDGQRVGRAADVRALRADAERLIELYGDWTRTLLDGLTDLAGSDDGDHDDDVVRLGPATPGTEVSATAYLHLLDGPLAAAPDSHATALTAHHRGTIGADHVEIAVAGDDAVRDRLTVTVTVTVPAGVADGIYHGHLLVEGMPEVHLPISLEVRE